MAAITLVPVGAFCVRAIPCVRLMPLQTACTSGASAGTG